MSKIYTLQECIDDMRAASATRDMNIAPELFNRSVKCRCGHNADFKDLIEPMKDRAGVTFKESCPACQKKAEECEVSFVEFRAVSDTHLGTIILWSIAAIIFIAAYTYVSIKIGCSSLQLGMPTGVSAPRVWCALLSLIQGVIIVGLVTTIRNFTIKVRYEGKTLSRCILVLIFCCLIFGVFLGAPFFIASYMSKVEMHRILFLHFGISLGVLMPVWLDPFHTLIHEFGRIRGTEVMRQV